MVRCFEVPGMPEGKGRPRYNARGGMVHTYTPKKTVEYEKRVLEAYCAEHGSRDPYQGAVGMRIFATYPVPKSWPKKRRELALHGLLKPCVKPDLDNLCKAVMDALNGVAYCDDKQVVRIIATKTYGENASVQVELREEGCNAETDA